MPGNLGVRRLLINLSNSGFSVIASASEPVRPSSFRDGALAPDPESRDSGSPLRVVRNDDSTSHSRDVNRARVTVQSRPPNKEGAGNAGCDVHPQPRVQVKKHTS